MSWFTSLTGHDRETDQDVRRFLRLDGTRLHSLANERTFECGRFSMPSLSDLRGRATSDGPACPVVSETIGDVAKLLMARENAGAVFQVASQFNLLEMTSPNITPEHGVGRYENDKTQGPACAVACGAGTIYRNYFVPIGGSFGQSSGVQIDCLADVGRALEDGGPRYWTMMNGYALPVPGGLKRLNAALAALTSEQTRELQGKLRVGMQAGTEVTLGGVGHRVTQVFCSAMPVAYAQERDTLWAPIARLVLEAAYEVTLRVAAETLSATGNAKVFLTLLGGGAFGNRSDWIADAMLHGLCSVGA